jgi:gluconolactonase
MKGNKLFLVLLAVLMAGLVLSSGPKSAGQSLSVVAPGATPQAVNVDLAGGGSEGPAVDADGNVYFTTAQMGTGRKSGTIQKWTWADGKVVKYRDVDGAAIGSTFDMKGRLLVGEWDNYRITADDLKGHITVLVDSIDGRKILAPNTIVVDSKGGIYFTEWPGFKMMGAMPGGGPGGPGAGAPGGPGGGAPGGAMPAGGPSSGTPGGPGGATGPKIESTDSEFAGIDYISPDGKKVIQVAKIKGSHKVVLSPDGKTLIASGANNKLWKFIVNPDGTLKGQEDFCTKQCDNLSIDGMTFDENSNLYMAGDKVYVYNLNGDRLEAIDLPHNASNLKFAGKDRKTLFITGHGGVYTLEMAVKGAPTALDMAMGKK